MNQWDLADALLVFCLFIAMFSIAGLLGWMGEKIDNKNPQGTHRSIRVAQGRHGKRR